MARVLIVDDDDAVRVIVAELAAALGHEVVAVDGASAALESLAAGTFEVVLSDVHMRPVDGMTLARVVRARWPALGVVLMTARRDDEVVDGARDAGVAAVLSKPLSLAELGRAIERAASCAGWIAAPHHPGH